MIFPLGAIRSLLFLVMLAAGIFAILILALAWTHYPHGIRRGYCLRKEREKRGYDR